MHSALLIQKLIMDIIRSESEHTPASQLTKCVADWLKQNLGVASICSRSGSLCRQREGGAEPD